MAFRPGSVWQQLTKLRDRLSFSTCNVHTVMFGRHQLVGNYAKIFDLLFHVYDLVVDAQGQVRGSTFLPPTENHRL